MSSGISPQSDPRLKAKDVCEELGIQPYVLKFWESEFPQLGKLVGHKRVYDKKSLSIVGEIRRLVEEEHLTLAQARTVLSERFPVAPVEPPQPAPVPRAVDRPVEEPAQAGLLQEARERIQELESKLSSAQDSAAERAAERDALERGMQTERQKASLAEEARQRAESELEALRSQLESVRPEIASLQSALGSLESSHASLEAANSGLEEQLLGEQGTSQQLRAQLEALGEEFDTEAAKRQHLEAALAEQRERFDSELAGHRERFDSELADHRERIDRLTGAEELLDESERERLQLLEQHEALVAARSSERAAMREDVLGSLSELRDLRAALDRLSETL